MSHKPITEEQLVEWERWIADEAVTDDDADFGKLVEIAGETIAEARRLREENASMRRTSATGPAGKLEPYEAIAPVLRGAAEDCKWRNDNDGHGRRGAVWVAPEYLLMLLDRLP